MYGLVNKAIQDMVCNRFGEQKWQEIKQKAEIDVEIFISMEGYPDDVTHRLVKAASQVLELSPNQIMQAFGEFWIEYISHEGFGEMMDMFGETLPELLDNLDNLHSRIGVSFPKSKPPSFEVEELEHDTLNLQYRSTREGLAPMVVGLVKGLGKKFDTEVDITQTQSRGKSVNHDEFLVKYKQK